MAITTIRATGSDGRSYVVIKNDGVAIDITHLSGSHAQTLDGLANYRLEDGRPVNVLDKGRYEIAGTFIVLTPTVA